VKEIEIYRDPESRRLGFRMREDHKLVLSELSTHTEVRKLRRQLRHTYGRSVRLSGLGG
jgi:hypothetical protein